MKFTINAGELASVLCGPCGRAKVSTVIPILKHVRCEARDSRLSLLGHDMDASSEAFVGAEVAKPGACAIPAEPLSRLIGGLPKASHVTIEAANGVLTIASGRSRYRLPILDERDMPEPLSASGGVEFAVTTDDLEQLFQRPRAAIDVKEPSVCFQGFFLHNEGGQLCSVTTDRHFLLRFSTEIAAEDFAGAIIPRCAADEIMKIGAGTITISDRIVSISNGKAVYSSKIIDAKYPENFRKVIPGPSLGSTIYREAGMEALQRLRAIGDFSESDLIDISVGAGELSFSVVGSADGSEAIECETEHNSFICLRGSHLLSALKSMTGDKAELHISSESAAFRLIDPSEPSAICVLMPCVSKSARRSKAA